MIHRPLVAAILAMFCAMSLSSPGFVMAQSLQYHLVSANDWLYPDTPIPASARASDGAPLRRAEAEPVSRCSCAD